MKKIGIIGSGIVAQTLGAGFLKKGYKVMMGTRDKSKLAEWQKRAGASADVASFSEAAAFGDIIVLAVKGSAAMNAITLTGKANLKGKIVIDTTNPIAEEPPVNGVLKFYTGLGRSLMEDLQASAPAADFVKAFNSVGNALMVDPPFQTKPTMFICGNNENAKKEVSEIIDQFGWEAADFGKAESARAIEPLCMLWCIPGLTRNEWSHAFKLLR